MNARQDARNALTGALLLLNYPTDSRALELLGELAKRFQALPPNAPDEEFHAIADLAHEVRFRLEIGLALPD